MFLMALCLASGLASIHFADLDCGPRPPALQMYLRLPGPTGYSAIHVGELHN